MNAGNNVKYSHLRSLVCRPLKEFASGFEPCVCSTVSPNKNWLRSLASLKTFFKKSNPGGKKRFGSALWSGLPWHSASNCTNFYHLLSRSQHTSRRSGFPVGCISNFSLVFGCPPDNYPTRTARVLSRRRIPACERSRTALGSVIFSPCHWMLPWTARRRRSPRDFVCPKHCA